MEVSAEDILAAFSRMPLLFLTLAALISFGELALRTFRFRLMLAHFGRSLSFRAVFSAQLIGIFAGNLTPMRLGEPLKALALWQSDRVPVPIGVVATVLERVLDLVILTLFLLVALLVAVGTLPVSSLVVVVLAVLLVVVYAGLMALVSGGRLSQAIVTRTKQWNRFRRIGTALETVAAEDRPHGRASATWALLSVVILLVDVSILYVLLLGYGVPLPFLLVLAVVSLAALGGVAAQTPGGVAATEAVMVSLFIQAGTPPAIALGVTLLARVLSFYLFTVLGWILAVRSGVRLTAGDQESAVGRG